MNAQFVMRLFFGICLIALLSGCRVNSSSSTLDSGFYRILRSSSPELSEQKVYVMDTGDSIQLVLPKTDKRRSVPVETYRNWTFYSTEVDVDVFTLPFKIRPSQGGLPSQLNSNFNAALYLGRRLDFHRYRWQPVTPTFGVRQHNSQGFGYGVFTGIGSASINSFVTHSPLSTEYEGVIVDAGIAAIYDARIFNIGIALGVDHLLDSNRNLWIYQQKPWFGVLFGLNLN